MPRDRKSTVDSGTHRRQADVQQERENRRHYRDLKERLLKKFGERRAQ